MSTFLPKEVQAGLDAARIRDQKRKSRMMVEADGQSYRVLRFWQGGFALEADSTPLLRGYVDIYDRGHHLYQCLILATAVEGGERLFEFKRITAISTRPPLDFVPEVPEVGGLLEHKPQA